MTKFRETLWFKKGELDAAAAHAEEPVAVDTLPIEDRYLDDGSIGAADTASFSVRTGQTQPVAPLRDLPAPGIDASATLIGELKRGRRPIVAVIGLSLAGVLAIVAIYAL